MDQFEYNRYVVGKNNIGHKAEVTILGNLLSQGEDVVIYEPPRAGKTSLVQQTLYNMKIESRQYVALCFDAISSRTVTDFLCGLGDAVLKMYGSTQDDFASLVKTYFDGTHFVFDPLAFSSRGRILSLNWDLDDEDILAVLRLPRKIAKEGQLLIVVIDDFQVTTLCERGENLLHLWENDLKEADPQQKRKMSWVFCGSRLNAMKFIFEERRYFYRQCVRVALKKVEDRDIAEYIIKCFLSTGKVVERDLLMGACSCLKGNLCYINQFCAICDSLSKGFIYQPTLTESLEILLAIHRPRFVAAMSDLTEYQIRMLRAIINGVKHFNTAGVIQRYGLNSAANVHRLRDALCKKEIVTFDENDEPLIIDPLMEYWLEKFYFEIQR